MRRELERIEIPGEHDARTRTWRVVRAGFEAREPVPQRFPLRPVFVAVAIAAIVAAAFTPAGRAVVDTVRELVGVEGAEEALFALPADGRLLVVSDGGAWIVDRDGSRRRLRDYDDASWSPFGRFVVATRRNELAALDPEGEVRWTLPRRRPRLARWGGRRVDTRIAYLSGSTLRVVAGDGEDDRLLARRVTRVAPAWRPGARHVVAFAGAGGVPVVAEADSRRVLWRSRRPGVALDLRWSGDGRWLLARHNRELRVYTADGALAFSVRTQGEVMAAEFRPRTRQLAYVVASDDGTQSRVLLRARRTTTLFTAAGNLDELQWAPDGRWLVAGWPSADQLLFIRAPAVRNVEAFSSVREQFDSRSFPSLAGWCCS